LSNLIKSTHVIPLEDLKRIELLRKVTKPQNVSHSDNGNEGNSAIDVETQSLKERILRDAEQTANEIIREARETAERLQAEAREQAEAWWRQRRQDDEQEVARARESGYEAGYRQGLEDAERAMREQWESRLQEAGSIVRQAYAAKESIIEGAERFLVELSCKIAEKVLAKQFEQTPELTIELIRRALARRKEQGVITLCVAPAQFAFVQASKDELAMLVDSQAELQIVPDASVGEGGCVIRSPFGSIDARIDTQMAAIRQELLRVAAHAAEERDADEQDA
jgi:flagellar assembly protein FliH